MNYSTIGSPVATGAQAGPTDLRSLFHELNNQLGVILAHAELIEAKSADAAQRGRASQVVDAALEAMAVARSIREHSSA